MNLCKISYVPYVIIVTIQKCKIMKTQLWITVFWLCSVALFGQVELIDNGAFSGLSSGNVPSDGMPWASAYRSPQINNSDGCAADGAVQLFGNQAVGEGLEQAGLTIMQGEVYTLSFCAKFSTQTPSSADQFVQVVVRASDSRQTGQNCAGNCQVVATTNQISSTEWANFEFEWTADDNYDRLTFHAINSSDQASSRAISWARIDDISLKTDSDLNCPNVSLVLNGTVTSTATFQTQRSIRSTATIAQTATVDYIAGDTIFLLDGFRIEEGAIFNTGYDCLIPIHTDEQVEARSIEAALSLAVFPNPIQANAVIETYLPKSGSVMLSVWNMNGQQLQQWDFQVDAAGQYAYPIDMSAYGVGLYIVRLQSESGMVSEKVMVSK